MNRALGFLVLLTACADSAVDDAPERCDAAALEDTWTGPTGAVLTIVATDPAPPARFTNWWTVTVDDPGELVVSAFMPEHGHASPTTPTVTAAPEGLVVGPIELWMPGWWEVRFEVDGDRITVPVCIEE